MDIQLYANDLVVQIAVQVATKLSSALDYVAKWLSDSSLTMNTKKTVTTYFMNKQKQKYIKQQCLSMSMDQKIKKLNR